MLTKLWYIICDGCGHPQDSMYDTGTDAREVAKNSGWVRIGKQDFHRHCVPSTGSTPEIEALARARRSNKADQDREARLDMERIAWARRT